MKKAEARQEVIKCHALLGKGGSNNPFTADKFNSLGFLRIGRT